MQRVVIDLDGGAFLGAARHQADGGELAFARFAEADVVGARQAAAHQHAGAGGAHVGVIGGAARHGEIEIGVLENLGTAAVPVADDVGDALAQNLGNEESAVEEDGVGDLAGRLQEFVQVARDGGVGDVGQAEFAEEAALFVLRKFAALAHGQKAFERQFERFLAEDLGLERFADEGRAGAEHGDLDALQGWDR